MISNHLNLLFKKKSLPKNIIQQVFQHPLPILTGIVTGVSLLANPVAARTFQANTYTSGTHVLDDASFAEVQNKDVLFTETSTTDTVNKYYSIFGVTGVDTVLDLSSLGQTTWDLQTLRCGGLVDGYDCNSTVFQPNNRNLSFVSVEKGGQATVQSNNPLERLQINAGQMKLAVVYNEEAEVVNNQSRITLKNAIYTTTLENFSGIGDQLSRYVSTAPATQKAADAPFSPNFVIENSTIYGYRLGDFTHSDVYLKDSQFLSYIPTGYVPAGAPLPPPEQLYSSLSCSSCSGLTLTARNGRIVADNILIRSAGTGISLDTGLLPSNPSNLDRGNFGTLDLTNSTVITYKQYATGISSTTGTLSTDRLITKLKLDGVDITTYGLEAKGIFSNYSNSILRNSTVTTFGENAYAVQNDAHGYQTIEQTDITTYGTGSHALVATANTGLGTSTAVTGPVEIRFTNGSITTHGADTYGIYAGTVSRGVTPTMIYLDGNLQATNVNTYTGGVSLRSMGNGSVLLGIFNGAGSVASGIAAQVDGDQSVLAKVSGTIVNNGINKTFRSYLNLDNAVLQSHGQQSYIFQLASGGVLHANQLFAETTGQSGHFLLQQGSTSAHISQAEVNLKGSDAHFIFSQGKSSASTTPIVSATVNPNTPLLGGNFDTKDILLEDVQVNVEQGMAFVLLGGETNHLTLNHVNIQAGSTLASDSQWLLYADNYKTYDINNALTGNYRAKDIQLHATDTTMEGSIFLKGNSQVNDIQLDASTLKGHVHVMENSQLANMALTNDSVWQGASFQDTNLNAIEKLHIDNTSTWKVFGGTTSHIGALHNAGTIQFLSSGGQFQTIQVDTDYTGGGTIIMNGAYRSHDTDSQRDQLWIAGNVVGDPTKVIFQSVDNIGAQTVGDGIAVIKVAGASQASDFQQQGNLYAGLYEYTMRAGTADGTFDGTWYLSSDLVPTPPPVEPPATITPSEEPPPFIPPNPGPEPEETPDPEVKPNLPPVVVVPPQTPNYRPEVVTSSIIPALAYASGMAQIATYQDRIAGTDDQTLGSGQWFRHFHTKSDMQFNNNGSVADKVRVFEENGANYDSTLHGFQVGMDLLRSDNASDTSSSTLQPMHKAGVYAGVTRTRAHVDALLTDTSVGSVGMTSLALGAYYTEHFESGLYTDNNVAVNFLQDISSNSYDSRQGPAKTSGHALILSSELGYRHPLSETAFVEPQIQAVYQNMKINDLQFAPDLHARFDQTDALTTRAGIRLGTNFGEQDQNTAYVRAAYEQSHTSQADIHYHNPQIGSATERVLHNEMHGRWMKIDAGVNGQIAQNTTGYLTLDYAQSLGDTDSQKVGLKAGFQYHF